MEIESIIGEQEKPLLLARGSFQIDLRDFDIEGAEGPAPAKYTLEFDINLKIDAKESGAILGAGCRACVKVFSLELLAGNILAQPENFI